MDLYVYETSFGQIADFRAYLDGHDHAFDDHRDLEPQDPRWEKVRNLRHPVRQRLLDGDIRYVGQSQCDWSELTIFPIEWTGEFDPVEWAG